MALMKVSNLDTLLLTAGLFKFGHFLLQPSPTSSGVKSRRSGVTAAVCKLHILWLTVRLSRYGCFVLSLSATSR